MQNKQPAYVNEPVKIWWIAPNIWRNSSMGVPFIKKSEKTHCFETLMAMFDSQNGRYNWSSFFHHPGMKSNWLSVGYST